MAVKAWKDGDYVDATQLNALVTGSNLTFANAAARDAFLVGALAPVPGMLVHLLDDGITYLRAIISGVSYWLPAPGTLICAYQQTTTQNFNAGVFAQIVNLTTSAGRTSPWWAADKFTPQLPGWYQLDGLVSWSAATADAGRGQCFTFNGITNTTVVPGSMSLIRPTRAEVVAYPTRTSVKWMNGTTDYVALCAYNESAGAQATVVSATVVSALQIKYLGP